MANEPVEFFYVRPNGMFPDGLSFPKKLKPVLRMRGLIEQAYDDSGELPPEAWADQFWFTQPTWTDDEEAAADSLLRTVEKSYRKYGHPVGSRVEGLNPNTQQWARGEVEQVAVSDLEPGVIYLTVVNEDGSRVTIDNRRVRPVRR